MTTQTEALKQALEALDQLTNAADTFSVSGVYFNEEVWAKKCLSDAYFAITTIEEALAQPEQERNLKLLPREATPEMLEAMDECSMEGYDERLYAGHAGSVYMAAWDAFAHPPVPTAQPKEPEQEPVAMKFKIYKPTVPDPVRQGINNALLPWVYDQDRSSGFDASMWVTPVATLPPQRKPLTDEQIETIANDYGAGGWICDFARAIEAAHSIKGDA